MTDLTDPKLAHLVARYRAWVAKENRRREALRDDALIENWPGTERLTPGLLGFMDWLIREGIEVPEEDAT